MKNKIKIAILIDLLIAGGVQKTAIEEVRNLRKMGFNASLLVLMRKGFSQKNRYLVKNIPFAFLSDRYPKVLQKSFRVPYFKFLSTLHLFSPLVAHFFVSSGEFDIILSHGTTTSFTALSLLYFKKIPYLVMIHDPMAYIFDKVYKKTPLAYLWPLANLLIPIIEKRIVKNAACCFVASKVHAQFLRLHYGISPIVLYLGVKPQKSIVIPHGNKVLSLGRWEKEKNIATILDLAQNLPKTKFIVAGSWTDKTDLAWFKSEIKKRGLEKQIELIINYQEEELPKIMGLASFWVHPNFEAFSLSAIEAATHGLPIVIPDKSGVTELFKNGIHGFFPKANDSEGLLEAVKYLIQNPQKARQMGAAAAKIARLYTWQRHSKIIAAALNNFFKH
ncbi:glycosyltransferase family 4 protein [Candidatus Curtissbacteria bacterium]|nr:glycosyltransferase family 4 protein [Candidatus Curtissbacteria bacterium]